MSDDAPEDGEHALKSQGRHFHDEDEHDEDDHPPASEGEGWLVSYADLMTLLFGFFAMLFTYATFEDETEVKYVKVNQKVAKYFGNYQTTPIEAVAKELKGSFKDTPFVSDIDLRISDQSLEISFISSVIFPSSSAEILPASKRTLYVMVDMLKEVDTKYEVRVEGHCDDSPMKSAQFPSNWELSAARAAAVVRIFVDGGFPADQMGAVGFGSSRPAFPNRDEAGKPIPANQLLNRRVVIKVIPLERNQVPVAIPSIPPSSTPNKNIEKAKE